MLDTVNINGLDPKNCELIFRLVGYSDEDSSFNIELNYSNNHFGLCITSDLFDSSIVSLIDFIKFDKNNEELKITSVDGDLILLFKIIKNTNHLRGEESHLFIGLTLDSLFPFADQNTAGTLLSVSRSIEIIDKHELIEWLKFILACK